MSELMGCLKRSDKQGILKVVQRDYILKQKVKEAIDKFADVGGCNCQGGECDQCIMNIRISSLKKELSLE